MSCRSARRRGRHEELADEELPDVPVPPEAEALGTRDLVRRALARLSVDRREAVVLHHVHGLSFQEVGAVQGVSATAAKLRSHRGMVELRGILTGSGR